jgi:hypothetical protein
MACSYLDAMIQGLGKIKKHASLLPEKEKQEVIRIITAIAVGKESAIEKVREKYTLLDKEHKECIKKLPKLKDSGMIITRK